jgi:hypothetical protein
MDDHMATEKNGNWWKGSFPVLLAVCGYFLKRELDTNDLYRWETAKAITTLQVDVTDLKTRMGLLEDRTRENHQLLDQNMAVCNTDQLMQDAKCWFCLEPDVLVAIELQLLCEIYSALAS